MTPDRELMELRSKVEEFRKWLEARLSGFGGHILMDKFSSLFPPPKPKGCWGFWKDLEIADGVFARTVHPLPAARDKAQAEQAFSILRQYACNPSPVFFLPEEK